MLITHEDEVAAHATRLIRLVDGQIVDDVRQDGSVHELLRDLPVRAARASAPTSCAPALTMLGILIGVAAVILLVAVGNGSAKAVEQSRIEALGTNTLTVQGGARRRHAPATAPT